METSLVLAYWLLGRSRYTRPLIPVLDALLRARSGEPVEVEIRGIRLDGATYDLTGGTLQKRP